MKTDKSIEILTAAMRDDTLPDLSEMILEMDDLERRDRDGRTLLINASFYNRVDIVKLLIKRGANVNAKDSTGNTPLHAAVQESNIEIIRILLENGADINSKNSFGNTPIWIVNPLQPKEVLHTLLHYGADPEIKNDYNISAADCMAAYPEIVEMFKTRNAYQRHSEMNNEEV